MELTALVLFESYLEQLFFYENILTFLCFVGIFCYFEHSPLCPSESCLLGNGQLHNFD